MDQRFADLIEEAIDIRPVDMQALSGGSVGEVYRVRLAGGEQIVAKIERKPGPQLALEAYMLGYLADHCRLPVPSVLYVDESTLLLEFLPGKSVFSAKAQGHAAELLADLHSISGESFGFDRDTLIGGLHQPNPSSDRWLDFFAEHRLHYMGREGLNAGHLPKDVFSRLSKFIQHLDRWLVEPERPALIHGDAWTGNILASGDQITAFLDPAVYFGHPEIELAFTTLFNTFGDPFFRRYREIGNLDAGFFEERKDIYNLFPILVHVRLFAGGYVSSVDRILRRFGY